MIRRGLHLADADPFLLFDKLQNGEQATESTAPAGQLDPSHAFYLGYEMAKAATALALGKQYEQDEPLDWGFLTVQEKGHRLTSRRPNPPEQQDADSAE